MPLFDFQCIDPNCQLVQVDIFQPIKETTPYVPCPACGSAAAKILAFPAIKPSLQPHFNAATNTYVTSDRQLRDVMKAQSAEISARTGVAHDFTPIDRRETSALGVTEEGLDETRRRTHVSTKKYL